MTTAIHFEENLVGESRITSGRTITEADVVIHAGHTGDYFPHHVDAHWASTSEFGQRIAHGTLIFAFAAGLTAGVINPVAFSYGYDRMRFVAPVFLGDTITVRAEITGKRDNPKRPERGFVEETCLVHKQDGTVVLSFLHLYSVLRLPADAGPAES